MGEMRREGGTSREHENETPSEETRRQDYRTKEARHRDSDGTGKTRSEATKGQESGEAKERSRETEAARQRESEKADWNPGGASVTLGYTEQRGFKTHH